MMRYAFTKADVGLYADGAFGHEHLRNKLADLLVHVNPKESPRISKIWAETLISLTCKEPPDDCRDEDEAIELLNECACAPSVHFVMRDGDLILVDSDVEWDEYRAEDEDIAL